MSFTIHSDFSSLLFLFFVFDSTSLPSLSMEAVFQFVLYFKINHIKANKLVAGIKTIGD